MHPLFACCIAHVCFLPRRGSLRAACVHLADGGVGASGHMVPRCAGPAWTCSSRSHAPRAGRRRRGRHGGRCE
eukprot:11188493-Lingulodinium_polyedra.AAC.1